MKAWIEILKTELGDKCQFVTPYMGAHIGIFSKFGHYQNKTNELDIMATDYAKKSHILGECKYKNQKFTMGDLKNMQKKIKPKNQTCQFYYWIFSKGRYIKEARDAAKNENTHLVTIEDIAYETN